MRKWVTDKVIKGVSEWIIAGVSGWVSDRVSESKRENSGLMSPHCLSHSLKLHPGKLGIRPATPGVVVLHFIHYNTTHNVRQF